MSVKVADSRTLAGLCRDWVGALPSDWRLVPLKTCARVFPSNVDKNSTEGEIPVRLCNYTDVYYREIITGDEPLMTATATEGEIRKFTLRAGDTIITKDSEDASDIGRSAYVPNDIPGVLCGYHLSVIRPTDKVLGAYLKRLFDSEYLRAVLEVSANGLTRVGLGQYSLDNLDIPLPSVGTQRVILNFLDRETAKIDGLIAKQEQLIATLREDGDAEWSTELDSLVQNWGSAQIRRVVASIADGPFGSSLTSNHYSPDGTRVIRLGNIGINQFKDEDRVYIPNDYAKTLSAHSVICGDVVVAGLGDDKMPLGRAAVVPAIGEAIVKADCYRVRPSSKLSGEFLAWALSAPPTRVQIALLARGSTRSRLNTSVVAGVTIPVPPLDIQTRTVTKSKKRLSDLGALVSKANEMTSRLLEFRAALITCAVTGKLSEREMV